MKISILLHSSMLFHSQSSLSLKMKATIWRINSSIAEEFRYNSSISSDTWRRMQRKKSYWLSSDQWWRKETCNIDSFCECNSWSIFSNLIEEFSAKNLSSYQLILLCLLCLLQSLDEIKSFAKKSWVNLSLSFCW